MTQLSGRRVFLSASFPTGERAEQVRPFDVGAIADATTAVARAVLAAGGRLVFGAHPTISPLVLLVASELDCRGAVEIHQSRFYEDRVPPETLDLAARGFGVIHWWPRQPGPDAGPSNRAMREGMFLSRPPFAAAIFIGGMDGIHAESEMLADLQPDIPRLAVRAPGGAARALPPAPGPVPDRLDAALRSQRYPAMAHEIVAVLAQTRPEDVDGP